MQYRQGFYLAEFTWNIGDDGFAFESVEVHAFAVFVATGQFADGLEASADAFLQFQGESVFAGFADFRHFEFLNLIKLN